MAPRGKLLEITDAEPVLGANPSREDVKKIFRYRIHRLTLAKGWTQAEVARRADIPPDGVSTYFRGKSLPDAMNAARLAAALGTTVAYLLPGLVEDGDLPAGSPCEMFPSKSRPGQYDLRVSMTVPLKVAAAVLELLGDYAPEAGAAGRPSPAQGSA